MQFPRKIFGLIAIAALALPASAQEAEKPSKATLSFVGRGSEPIRVIEKDGSVTRLRATDLPTINTVAPMSRYRTLRQLESPEDQSEEEALQDEETSPVDGPGQGPTPTAEPEDDKPEIREDLIREHLQRTLTQQSVTRIPAMDEGTRRGRNVAGPLERDALGELNEEEAKLLESLRTELLQQSTPALPESVQYRTNRSSVLENPVTSQTRGTSPELIDEAQGLRDTLRDELLKSYNPTLPPAAKARNERRIDDRVERDQDPAAFTAPIPAHLLQQGVPQLPDSKKRKPRSER